MAPYLPNTFEWIILGIALLLIAGLMNMFPMCRWIAEKTLGVHRDKTDGKAP